MKKIAILISILAVIAVVIFLALGNLSALSAGKGAGMEGTTSPTRPAEAAEPTLPAVRSGDTVVAECRLVPVRFVNLSFNRGGLVEEVLFREGDTVAAGETLAKLSNQEQLQAAVVSAELELLNVQQEIDALYQNAPLEAAEALNALVNSPLSVQSAERRVNSLKYGVVNESDISVARANLTFAENKLKSAEDAYRPYANKAEDNLTRAALLSKLAQAQKEYEASLQKLNSLLGVPSDTKITQAEAELALARMQQVEAERKYEILQNGPDPNRLALANARLANAEAQLAAAKAAFNDLELIAPFAGTLVSLELKAGEYVAPGVPLLLLVDLDAWQVETTNLTELSVVHLNLGNPAVVTFDAIPDLQFMGGVNRIKPFGENTQGDITYTAVIDLDQYDRRLLWNMTCSVVIDTK